MWQPRTRRFCQQLEDNNEREERAGQKSKRKVYRKIDCRLLIQWPVSMETLLYHVHINFRHSVIQHLHFNYVWSSASSAVIFPSSIEIKMDHILQCTSSVCVSNCSVHNLKHTKLRVLCSKCSQTEKK
jgi:hypothetical protein